MVGSIEDWHMSESSSGQRRSDRLRKDPAVDDAGNRGGRKVAQEIFDRQVAQALRGLIRTAFGRKGLSKSFGRDKGLLRQRERSTFDDGPVEEPPGTAGDEVH